MLVVAVISYWFPSKRLMTHKIVVKGAQLAYDYDNIAYACFRPCGDPLFLSPLMGALPVKVSAHRISWRFVMQIIIPSYSSQGPGFCGRIELALLNGNKLVQRLASRNTHREGETQENVYQLPYSLGAITELHDCTEADIVRMQPYLASSLDWVTEEDQSLVNFVESDFCKIIKTNHGEDGFVIVWGEPCYMSLCIGNRVVEFGDGGIDDVEPHPLLGPFPELGEMSPEAFEIRSVVQQMNDAAMEECADANGFELKRTHDWTLMREDLVAQVLKRGGFLACMADGTFASVGYPKFKRAATVAV